MDNKISEEQHKYEMSIGRKTGKTTRMVDKAVQHLFNTGKLVLDIRPNSQYGRHSDFIDDDFDGDNYAQDYFIGRVMTRLSTEHCNSYSVSQKGKGGLTIKVKDEY